MTKALVAWSSGKDSAWALHEARRSGELEIVGALTTVKHEFCRVSMHGTREELLAAQLEAARLPAISVRIPFPCPNEIYEREMAAALETASTHRAGSAEATRSIAVGGAGKPLWCHSEGRRAARAGAAA